MAGFSDPARAGDNVPTSVTGVRYLAVPQIGETTLPFYPLIGIVVARHHPGQYDKTQIVLGGLKFGPGFEALVNSFNIQGRAPLAAARRNHELDEDGLTIGDTDLVIAVWDGELHAGALATRLRVAPTRFDD